MGWEEELFAVLEDLEEQAGAAFGAERDAEVLDRARSEYGTVTLASRLMASIGRAISLTVLGAGPVAGELCRVGDGWALVRAADQEWVVATTAIGSVRGLSERAVPEVAWSPLARLGLGSALRRMAEAQERCVLHLRDGTRVEAVPVRVGADFVEVATGDGAAQRRILLAQASLAAVQRRG